MGATMTHPLRENMAACTGCAACAGACPQDCVTMEPDAEGFPNQRIDSDVCNDCGLCRRICPVCDDESLPESENLVADRVPAPQVFAAWHLDDAIRQGSTSGGVFTALADYVFAQGGVVVGAAFDDGLVVRHVLIESAAYLGRLRGSKYVQSEMAPALFLRVRELLNQGRPVLFSGTPCQVSGIRHFLRRPFETLFCCDIVCHGVPSPLLLFRYGEHYKAMGKQLSDISFRDKATGWKRYSVRQHFASGETCLRSTFADPYMAAFLHTYCLREACYGCRFTNTVRWGDLTLADFWGVAKTYPEYDADDKGTSLLLANTTKGAAWLGECRDLLFIGPADIDTAVAGNSQLAKPTHRPPERDTFYDDLRSIPFRSLIRKYRLRPASFFRRVAGKLRGQIRAVWGRSG